MVKLLKYLSSRRSVALLSADMLLLFVTTSVLQAYVVHLNAVVGGHTVDRFAAPFVVTIIVTLAVATMSFCQWDFCWDRRSWILRLIVACLLVVVILILARSLLYPDSVPNWADGYVQSMGFYIAAVAAFIFGIHALRFGPRLRTRRILLIGNGERAANVEELARKSNEAISVVGRIRNGILTESEVDDVKSIAMLLRHSGIHEVVVAADDQRGLPMDLLLQWKFAGIRVIDYLTFWERECGRVDLGAASPSWFVYGQGCNHSRAAKRCFDIVVSLFLLALTIPLMLTCAALIWLESGGPILYRQERVGCHGRVFNLLKFRSMRVDAETAGRPQWARKQDTRVTRVGSLIRRLRMDEIPQLWNVVRNDMSLIGPRPERAFFVEQLAKEIPFYRDRHWVKPGITGWAQINFPYGASFDDARQKLSYDLYYVKNSGFFLDVFIAVATIRVILFQEGAR
jgi:sugar transferase (PEP-CTERM system associated)